MSINKYKDSVQEDWPHVAKWESLATSDKPRKHGFIDSKLKRWELRNKIVHENNLSSEDIILFHDKNGTYLGFVAKS